MYMYVYMYISKDSVAIPVPVTKKKAFLRRKKHVGRQAFRVPSVKIRG